LSKKNVFWCKYISIFYLVLLYYIETLSARHSKLDLQIAALLICKNLIKKLTKKVIKVKKFHRKMTIIVAQYLPKMVECLAAFSNSGSMYLHDMFSLFRF